MNNNYWYPKLTDKFIPIKTNSWFNSSSFNNPDYIPKPKINNINDSTYISILKVPLYPNTQQKLLLHKWFDNFTDMWNATNKFLTKKLIISYPQDPTIFSLDLCFNNPTDNTQKSIKDRSARVQYKNKLLCDMYKKYDNIKSTRPNNMLTKNDYQKMKQEKEEIIKNYKIKYSKYMIKLNESDINEYLNFNRLRDKYVANEKKKIVESKIPVHILDEAIDHNKARFQSAISNFQAGHIDSFRMRYWEKKRRRNIMILEKTFFSKIKSKIPDYLDIDRDGLKLTALKTMIETVFNDTPFNKNHNKTVLKEVMKVGIHMELDNTDFKNIKKASKRSYKSKLKGLINREIKKLSKKDRKIYSIGICMRQLGDVKCGSIINEIESVDATSTIIYDRIKRIYTLLIPVKKEIKKMRKKTGIDKKIPKKCGIDGGGRIFATVYSEDKMMRIGERCDKLTEPFYDKIKEINKKKVKMKKRKYERSIVRINDKIENQIADMHWKASKKLCVENTIINIGKLSTTKIVSIKNDLPKKAKRTILKLSHTKFREILKLQGVKYGAEIRVVNEYMTTQECHVCGNRKKQGKNEKYKCEKCGLEIGRDDNASINMIKK